MSLGKRTGIRRLFRLPSRDAGAIHDEVDEEIRFHLDARVAQLVRRGMAPDDARREALHRFGVLDDARRTLRRSARRREETLRMRDTLDALLQDLRVAVRGLRRRPGFTVAVALTLALGIGANATMFGIVDRLLLRPPAFLDAPERTGRVFLTTMERDGPRAMNNIPYRRYLDLVESTRSLEQAAVMFTGVFTVGDGEAARRERVSLVSASFWSLFRAAPAAGRFFGASEDRVPSGTPVVVLGHRYWQTRYGGDPSVVGSSLRLGTRVYTVVGVAPEGFNGLELQTVAMYVPLAAGAFELVGGNESRMPEPWYGGYFSTWMEMVARRKPGVTAAQANADLTAAFRRSYLAEQARDPRRARPIEQARPRGELASILLYRTPGAGREARVALWLGAVSLLVLLIACANVASLLLARAVERRREIAVRLALGISRRRLLGQLLAESVLLALLGGAAGLLAADWGGGVLRRLLLPDVEWGRTLLDGRLLLFAAAVTLLAGLLTGLAPALQQRRGDVAGALKAGGREGSLRGSRLRAGLVVLQGAASVLLLVVAGLFVRSLRNVHQVDLGYDVAHVLHATPALRGVPLDSASRVRLQQSLLERAAALPGVESAALGLAVPFHRIGENRMEAVRAPGVDSTRLRDDFFVNAVSPAYFATTGLRLVAGRAFTPADRAGAPAALVISEQAARTIWPGENAVGKCLRRVTDAAPCETVVGVVENVRIGFSQGPARHVYVAIAQAPSEDAVVFVRTRGDAARMTETVRRALQPLMPGAAYVETQALDAVVAPAMRSWQLGASMFTLFGGLALVVAAVGLYSMIAYGVAQRRHELGVRVALGAGRGDVLRLVVGEGVRVSLVALAVGGALALVAGRWVSPMLYQVSARDPLTFGAVGVLLVAVALVASFVPARRAAGVDPMVALRGD